MSTEPQYNITPESMARELERLRAKARHDEAQALHHAKSQRSVEIARNALDLQLPVDTIQKLTGLSVEEIEELERQP